MDENGISDGFFNINDGLAGEWDRLLDLAPRLPVELDDYFTGIPGAPANLPANILVFLRDKPMVLGHAESHHRFVWVACLKGAASAMIDDRVMRLEPGTAIMVAPHQFHHYADFDDRAPLWLFITFEFPNAVAFEALRGRRLKLTPLQIACLRHIVEHWVALGGRREPCEGLTLATALLLETSRWAVSQESAETRIAPGANERVPLIEAVADYVHRHLGGPIPIADVARAVGYSGSHLRARFRQMAGIGLGAYIRERRLQQARRLLLTTTLRVKEIADACGYDTPYAFSRAFRQGTGTSPIRFRAQHDQKNRD